MNKQVSKFLEFNGKTLVFIAVDGQYWIALKPICEVLGVDYIQQFKNAQNDPLFGQILCNHTMVGADGKARKMVSLPEKWVYGWLTSVQSKSPELQEYKKLCYEVFKRLFPRYNNRKERVTKPKSKFQNWLPLLL